VQRGPEAGIAVGQMFANAFPDGRIEVRNIHTAGDTAIVEFTGSGTHTGDLMGIAPTRRQISVPVCDVITTRGGKIVSEREYMDTAHMMRQLGVMPAAATV
jgi:predicted ester cyclase